MKLGLANFTTLAWSIWQTFQLTLVQFFAFRQIFICANCQRLNKPSGHLVTPTTNIPSHPTLNLFDLTIPVYISRKQWLVSNCRPLILNATALPCTALPFTNTILLFLTHTHTHTHNFLLFLSHTLWNELTHIILAIQKAYFLLPLRLSRAALQEKQESDSKANSNLMQKQTFQFNSNGLFWR